MDSVREGGAILRGEKEPARRFEITAPDVKQIRERYELSQSEFAALLGVSVKTLQNWEQGRRSPQGAARRGCCSMSPRNTRMSSRMWRALTDTPIYDRKSGRSWAQLFCHNESMRCMDAPSPV
jgi:putative transcriptional regulator